MWIGQAHRKRIVIAKVGRRTLIARQWQPTPPVCNQLHLVPLWHMSLKPEVSKSKVMYNLLFAQTHTWNLDERYCVHHIFKEGFYNSSDDYLLILLLKDDTVMLQQPKSSNWRFGRFALTPIQLLKHLVFSGVLSKSQRLEQFESSAYIESISMYRLWVSLRFLRESSHFFFNLANTFIGGQTKVGPTKQLWLPRLELCIATFC